MDGRKIRRRNFLRGTSAAALLAARGLASPASAPAEDASQAPQASYAGPLGNVEYGDRQFDSLQFSLASYNQVKPSLAFSATSERAARQWQTIARHKLIELLGGFPATPVPLR